MRNKIWYNLVDCKTNEFYSATVTRYYQWAEWILNSFLVVTTSASVAAWAIWKEFYIVWAAIIGLSQVLMLLKPFLLFPKYIKTYSEKNLTYQYTSWELEKLWYNYENGNIDDSQAFKQYDEIKKSLILNDQFPDEVIVITHKKALTKAENRFMQFKNQL
jgi:hypothetical protein